MPNGRRRVHEGKSFAHTGLSPIRSASVRLRDRVAHDSFVGRSRLRSSCTNHERHRRGRYFLRPDQGATRNPWRFTPLCLQGVPQRSDPSPISDSDGQALAEVVQAHPDARYTRIDLASRERGRVEGSRKSMSRELIGPSLSTHMGGAGCCCS